MIMFMSNATNNLQQLVNLTGDTSAIWDLDLGKMFFEHFVE